MSLYYIQIFNQLKSYQRCSQAPNLKTLFCSTHETKNSVFVPGTVNQLTLKDRLPPILSLTQKIFPHSGEFRQFCCFPFTTVCNHVAAEVYEITLLAACVRV